MTRRLQRIVPVLTIGLLAVAAAVRLTLLVPAANTDPERFRIHADSAEYERIARNLVEHGAYSSAEEAPYVWHMDRTPVYPLYLAFFRWIGFSGILAPLLVQVGLYGLLLLILFRWCSRQFGVGAGCAAVTFCALEISGITASIGVMTESPFALLFFASVVAWRPERTAHGARGRVLSAVLLGVAILCRPLAKYWVLPAMILILVRAKGGFAHRLRLAGQYAVLPVLVILAWSFVNYSHGGKFTLSVVEERNLLSYRAVAVVAQAEGVSYAEAAESLEARVERSAAEGGAGPTGTALEIFLSHPGATACVALEGAGRAMLAPGVGLLLQMAGAHNERVSFPGPDPHMGIGERLALMFSRWDLAAVLTACSLAFLVLMYVLAAAGVWRAIRLGQGRSMFAMLLPWMYLVVASAGPEAGSRFRAPTLPFLAVGAAVGAAWCVQVVAARRCTSYARPEPGSRPPHS